MWLAKFKKTTGDYVLAMVLRSSSASPFARKVRIAAAVLGLEDKIEVLPADTMDPEDSLRLQNPLGKVPTLTLPGGGTLHDSAVILEYLDELAGGGQLIPKGADRFLVLTRAALADGILDAALLMVYEQRWRESSTHNARWLSHQNGKIERGLAALEISTQDVDRIDVATIGLACALGYLDLRFKGAWRNKRAGLVGWLDQFASRLPSFEATRHNDE